MYSGVINNDPDVIGKIEIAKKYRLKIDGHAPELVGDPLSLYIAHGIETDHESSTIEEAEEKNFERNAYHDQGGKCC